MAPPERAGDTAGRADCRLRVVFFGTSAFAEPVLRGLAAHHRVLTVVTQPDRPAGRGRRPRPSRIKGVARELELPVLEPGRIRSRRTWGAVAEFAPDCLVVADYGQILPAGLLRVPRLGAVNVHASLLPELRGAAPAAWAIARGFPHTGVTTMLMDAGLDTGPVLAQRRAPILKDDTGGRLLARLAPIGAELLIETLDGLARGTIEPVPQDNSGASLAPRIGRRDLALDWTLAASALAARIRAFSPTPTAFTAIAPGNGPEPTLLKIHAAAVGDAAPPAAEAPGACRISGPAHSPRLEVACGGGTTLLPSRVQAAGRAPLEIAAFLQGAEIPRLLGPEEALAARGQSRTAVNRR